MKRKEREGKKTSPYQSQNGGNKEGGGGGEKGEGEGEVRGRRGRSEVACSSRNPKWSCSESPSFITRFLVSMKCEGGWGIGPIMLP